MKISSVYLVPDCSLECLRTYPSEDHGRPIYFTPLFLWGLHTLPSPSQFPELATGTGLVVSRFTMATFFVSF